MKPCDLAALVHECCSEVLGSMYFTALLELKQLESIPGPPACPAAPVCFSLQFTGDVSGRFGLHLEQVAARALAANFLGKDETDISPLEIGEVAGELANMLCGSLMSRVEGEHTFALSHPEADRPAPPYRGEPLSFLLETDLGAIAIWILIERSDLCRDPT